MTASKEQFKIIFEHYFVQPWKPKVDIESLICQPLQNQNNFVVKNIIPELFEFLKDRKNITNEPKKSIYMNKLSKVLVEAKYLNFEKKSPKNFIKDLINPPNKKTDEEYFLEHQEKLKKDLYIERDSKFTSL